MTDVQKRQAAKQFAQQWAGKGDEKQQTQSFWISLLRNVFGVAEPEGYINFEMPVPVKTRYKGKTTTKYIDAYIPATKILIEQKSCDVDLFKEERQSDGQMFTAFDQAQNYANHLRLSLKPQWIILCNFQEFYIYNTDTEYPTEAPIKVTLSDFENEYPYLNILLDNKNNLQVKEEKVSADAGKTVSKLYTALLNQYEDPTDPQTLQSLNALCVRLVFCFYAEDSGVFSRKQFHNYMAQRQQNARQALIDLFRILDTEQDRDPYLDEDLLAFPYVNGGLFKGESIIPRINDEIYDLILHQGSEGRNWSGINPPVFGAMFESTLNPETRRDGGMHYTTVQDIHKVIDPLFLDSLNAEFSQIVSIPIEKTRMARLSAFQEKLASLTFLDPACGSGNFLTETYLSLRKLENQIISELHESQFLMGDFDNPVKVSISQFYGIEINDFAVSVAKAALWIAESQMREKTELIIGKSLPALPLKTNAHIIHANALRLDWNAKIPMDKINYIMGNPPFKGKNDRSEEQRDDLSIVWHGKAGVKRLDYVSGWYRKIADYLQNSKIRAALVSTNSIAQGEQVLILWKYLLEHNIHIDFAYQPFQWNNNTRSTAHVHCVIIGFSSVQGNNKKVLYTQNGVQHIENINPYLVEGPNIIIQSRKKPLSAVPRIVFGSMPNDNGFLCKYSDEDKEKIVSAYPSANKMFRRFLGADEFIYGKSRWCLWLKNISPAEIQKIPPIMEAIENVRKARESSNRKSTQKLADRPYLFGEIRQPNHDYILIPRHSSQKREYIPLGFISSDVICGDSNLLLADASLYHFGVLTSNIHMAWMRAVCGRLETRYRYSAEVVYNNFPWPNPTDEQQEKIEQTAQAILDARALYPDCNLDTLYNRNLLQPELLTAHQANDRAVWDAYGRAWPVGSESACVAHLMKLYRDLTR